MVKKALYILQITRNKLTEENMKVLKCILLHILRSTEINHIIIEVYFDEEEFTPFEQNIRIITKMLVTGYNLTEPELSQHFTLAQVEILMPQIFNSRSALL